MFKDVNGYMDGFTGNDVSQLDPAWLSWGLFSESGNPGYYLLYKSLLDEDTEER